MKKFKLSVIKVVLFLSIFSGIYTRSSGEVLKNDTLYSNLSKNKLANEFYNKGMVYYESSNVDSAIVMFKKAIGIDKKFADAYDKLAMSYIRKGDIYSRKVAEESILKAIELKPNDLMYNLHHGQILLKKRFRHNARRKFDSIIRKNPRTNNIDALIEIGRIYKNDMEDYLYTGGVRDTSMKAFIDDKMLNNIYSFAEGDSSVTDSVMNFLTETNDLSMRAGLTDKYAKKDFGHAVIAFSKALEIDLHNKNALYELAMLSLDIKMYDRFIGYLKKIILNYPDDKNAHLFLGFGYYKKNELDLAYNEYMKAKGLMDSEEKRVFESCYWVVPQSDLKEYKKMNANEIEEYQKEFWKKRDPLFLTEYNERELEHYSRIAYSNLKFYFLSWTSNDTIPGWKMDRGMIYTRYGHPRNIIRILSESGGEAEIWSYDGFSFTFASINRGGKLKLTPSYFAQDMYKKQPEIYYPPYYNKRFELGCYTASFRGNKDKSLLEIYYAIPVNGLEPKKEKEFLNTTLKEGVFLFDEKWNEVKRTVTKEKISLNSNIDYNKYYYIIGKEQIEIEPGEYNFSIEFQEDGSKKTGMHRDKISVNSYPFGELSTSDILLACNINPSNEKSKYVRNGLKIIPNPARLYQKTQLMNVYFEIYNLVVNPEQKTKFSIDYKISSELEKEIPLMSRIISRLGKIIGRKEGKRDITASYEYEGTKTTENMTLSIDMSSANEGFYYLTINVKDLNTNKNISKITRFGLHNYKVNYLF